MKRVAGETTMHSSAVLQMMVVLLSSMILSQDYAKSALAEPLKEPLSGRLNFVESALNSVGVQLAEPKLPASISNVKLGTAAYYAGLKKDDKIIEGALDQNILTIRIQRDGKNHILKLAVSLKALRALDDTVAQKPIIDRPAPVVAKKAAVKVVPKVPERGQAQVPSVATPDPDVQTAKIDQTTLSGEAQTSEILKKYRVVLVVDRSGSMDERDAGCDGLTKFAWCQKAIEGFAGIPEIAKRKFTLVLFNNYVDVISDCDAKTVERMFEETTPEGSTDLSQAITAGIRSHRITSGSAPCIVAVLHDGLPNRGADIEDVLIEATKQLQSEKDLVITFLQIGKARGGSELLKRLDNNLVEHGAKYDVVDSETFEELKAKGLKEAIVSFVKKQQSK